MKSAYFMTSASSLDECPKPFLPEVALIGRSNVGKSSLINDLLQKKGLAKTSATPGKTRLINFFSIDEKLLLVDLPGYGYTKGRMTDWEEMIETYLKKRETLRSLLLLIDCRRGVMKEDLQMYDWINYHGLPIILVLTKADKLKKRELALQTKKILEQIDAPYVCYSVKKPQGRKELHRLIDEMVR
ncbi:MAG: putative GTP-binding protein EngB [Chlamydiales bacterium]|nr:putative GTP-binding protein EngB [Chlamydiales bacterium]MCH9619743.1 putative GTP-binding protein EngB [Chlamydiales bacterium]MCH9623349.1 putative GTP-binding protein EngB [Chlamydiales bacterium]